MKVTVETTGATIGFAEGLSILKMQLAQVNIDRIIAAGQGTLVIAVEAGAGDTEQEEGSVGVFFNQAFTIYVTSFFNQPADPGYSIASR